MKSDSQSSFYLWNILASGLVERLDMQNNITGKLLWVGPSAHIIKDFIKQKKLSLDLICINQLTELEPNTADIIMINAELAWAEDYKVTLNNIASALTEGGMLMFSALGPNSILDIQQQALAMHWNPKNHALIDMHHWGDRLLKANYKDPVIDRKDIAIEFNQVQDWFQDWHKFGYKIFSSNHFQGLITPKKWQLFCRTIQNNLPNWFAELELIFAMAHKPTIQQQQQHDGSVAISLDALKSTLQSK